MLNQLIEMVINILQWILFHWLILHILRYRRNLIITYKRWQFILELCLSQVIRIYRWSIRFRLDLVHICIFSLEILDHNLILLYLLLRGQSRGVCNFGLILLLKKLILYDMLYVPRSIVFFLLKLRIFDCVFQVSSVVWIQNVIVLDVD